MMVRWMTRTGLGPTCYLLIMSAILQASRDRTTIGDFAGREEEQPEWMEKSRRNYPEPEVRDD